MEDEIVVLAKSIKNHGFCVAGKSTRTHQWIRPVSTPEGGELTVHQTLACFTNSRGEYCRYPCKPLQKIRMTFLRDTPLDYQRENYLIDENVDWIQNYKITESELEPYLDDPIDLWGQDDYILQGQNPEGNSLYLIRVQDLRLYRNIYNQRKASFFYNQIFYDLSCTDPNFDSLVQRPDLNTNYAILCISLAQPFAYNLNGVNEIRHYKLVASIYFPD